MHLSSSSMASTPSQSSSMPLFGISVAPGCIFALVSSQSTSLLKPSASTSYVSRVSGLQSSSIPLYNISEASGFTAGSVSSQSNRLLNPSPSASL